MTSLGEIAGRAIARDKELDKKAHAKKKEIAKKIQAMNPAGLDKRYKPKYH